MFAYVGLGSRQSLKNIYLFVCISVYLYVCQRLHLQSTVIKCCLHKFTHTHTQTHANAYMLARARRHIWISTLPCSCGGKFKSLGYLVTIRLMESPFSITQQQHTATCIYVCVYVVMRMLHSVLSCPLAAGISNFQLVLHKSQKLQKLHKSDAMNYLF